MSAAGDCRLLISHVSSIEEWDKFREQIQISTDVDVEIQNLINEIGFDENSSEFPWVWELTGSIEKNLSASAHAYEYSINVLKTFEEQTTERFHLLIKRFGNVRNEIGAFWMNQCAQAVKHSFQRDEKVRSTVRVFFLSMLEIALFFSRRSKNSFVKVLRVSIPEFKHSQKFKISRIWLC